MLRRLRNYPFLLWFGAALLLLACFLEFTDEFLETPEPGTFDLLILRELAELRSSVLTIVFVNLTALGSSTLIVLHTVTAFGLLLSTRDRAGALQLATASAGAFWLTELTKGFLERPRPTAVPALVEAFGYSYPSGHSMSAAAMYVTIALLAARHLRPLRQRVLLGVWTAIVIGGIGVSRVYLGVHYASDAISGILLGTAWALILAGLVSLLEHHGRKHGSGFGPGKDE